LLFRVDFKPDSIFGFLLSFTCPFLTGNDFLFVPAIADFVVVAVGIVAERFGGI
jgi:hypothetical protein